MKHLSISIFAVLLVLITGIVGPNITLAETEQNIINLTQDDIIPQDILNILRNSDLYQGELKTNNYDLSSNSFVPICRNVIWDQIARDLSPQKVMIDALQDDTSNICYITEYDNNILEVSIRKNGSYIEVYKCKNSMPEYLENFLAGSPIVCIENQNVRINKIYFFDMGSYQGTIIYMQTDKGMYVRYHDSANYQPEPLIFKESEFVQLAKKYYSLTVNSGYNEKGELVMGMLTFLSFINNDYIIPQSKGIHWYYIVGGILILGLSVVIAVYIICKKKNKT